MSLKRTVNLEWWKHEPGVLGVSRQGIGPDGTVILGMRDPLTPRTYSLITYVRDKTMDPISSASEPFTMETIHRLEAVPGAPFVLARTDQELYFVRFSGGRVDRTTFQPGRGMHFHDLSTAANNSRRSVAVLTQDRTGTSHTLCAAEARDTLMPLWTRTWSRPVNCVAVSPNGNWFAVGFEDGGVTLLDRRRKPYWDHLGLSVAAIVALVVDDNGSVVILNGFSNVKRLNETDGSVRWRVLLSIDENTVISPNSSPQYLLASNSTTRVIAATVAGTVTSTSGEQSLVSKYLLLDGENGGAFWENALPSLATGIAVSHNSNFVALTTRNGDIMVLSTAGAAVSTGSSTRNIARGEALLSEATKLVRAGQFFDALPLLDQAMKLNPANTDIASIYDDVRWQLRENVMAMTTKVSPDLLNIVIKALNILPFDEKMTVRRNALVRLLSEKWVSEGHHALDDARFDEAINYYLKALDLEQGNLEARSGLKLSQFGLAEKLRADAAKATKAKNYNEAMAALGENQRDASR